MGRGSFTAAVANPGIIEERAPPAEANTEERRALLG